MRRIVLFASVSADGFIAGPNGELDWSLASDELLQHMNGVLRGVSAFLEGRVVYEMMAAYWPTAHQDPAATAATIEFSRLWVDAPKLVYSRTLQHADWNATIVRDVVPEEVLRLKQEPGGDMILGGGVLSREFQKYDLIDEIRMYVHPVLLGNGIPLFARTDQLRPLRLLETHAFSNGIVLLHYAK